MTLDLSPVLGARWWWCNVVPPPGQISHLRPQSDQSEQPRELGVLVLVLHVNDEQDVLRGGGGGEDQDPGGLHLEPRQGANIGPPDWPA